jgi:hypothetical protein
MPCYGSVGSPAGGDFVLTDCVAPSTHGSHPTGGRLLPYRSIVKVDAISPGGSCWGRLVAVAVTATAALSVVVIVLVLARPRRPPAYPGGCNGCEAVDVGDDHQLRWLHEGPFLNLSNRYLRSPGPYQPTETASGINSQRAG